MKGNTTVYITFALVAIGMAGLLISSWKSLFYTDDGQGNKTTKVWSVTIFLGGIYLAFVGLMVYFIVGGYGYSAAIVHGISLGMILSSIIAGETQLDVKGGQHSFFFNSMTFVVVIFVFGILVAVNYLGVRKSQKFDFNANKIQTLSDQTIKALKGLKKPIKIVGFAYKDQKGIEQSIRHILKKYQRYNRKMFSFQIVNPMDAPSLAECYGAKQKTSRNQRMIPLIVSRGKCVKQNNREVFQGKKIVIPDPSEQSITNKLIKVSREGQKEICFLTGRNQPKLDDKTGRYGYGIFKKQLEDKGFSTRSINIISKQSVPSSCTVLVNAAPDLAVFMRRGLGKYAARLSSIEATMIQTYLNKGGKMLVFQEPQVTTGLETVLRRFGIISSKNLVVDFAVNYQRSPMRPLTLSFAKAHDITKGFTGRFRGVFSFVSPVTIATGRPPGVVLTSLTKTTQVRFSRRVSNRSCCSFSIPDIRNSGFRQLIGLSRNWKHRTVLSNVARGIVHQLVKDAKNGPFSLAVAASKKLKGTNKQTRLVVFGDSAIASNFLFRFDHPLVMNSIAWLAQEKDLVHIPAKRRKPSRIFLTSTQRNIINYTSMYGIPGTFLFIILLVMAIRRQK